MKTIKKVLIVFRDRSSSMISTVSKLELWFKKNHIQTKTVSQSSLLARQKQLSWPANLVVVLGGDGTYLQAVQGVASHDVPFLGFNMGSFGFLTVYRKSAITACLKAFLNNDMVVEQRSMIEVKLYRGQKQGQRFLALNDMVLERGELSHLISISVYIKSRNIYSVKADGLILSSPTGSTAYNLAAGGPILHPQARSYAITPICSHSLTNRPVIVPDTYEMKFKINNKKQNAFLTIDGRRRARVSDGHSVHISKSKEKHLTVREKNHNDFLLLREKLKFFI